MLAKQRSNHLEHQKTLLNCPNALTCLLVTLLLLLLFEGQATVATPVTRQRHQGHHHHHQQSQQQFQQPNTRSCEHKSLVELIKTSPIIIKALGARIYGNGGDEPLHVIQNNDDVLLAPWQSEQSARGSPSLGAAATSSSSTWSGASSAAGRDELLMSLNDDAILITLTPDTIYKGASSLKTATNAAMSSGSGTRSSSADTSESDAFYSSAESMMEGQLNATVQPFSCFDANLLKTLPTDLIIFGKLITIEQLQKQQGYRSITPPSLSPSGPYSTGHQPQAQRSKDILQISVNGLHRWSPQLESYIWTHLGWDDWSDFTVCSVACGKGVQQRFRRCLLDNPMVNLKMNFNEIAEEELQAQEEDLAVEQAVEQYDDSDTTNAATDSDANEEQQYDDIDRMIFEDDDDDELIDQLRAIDNYEEGAATDEDVQTIGVNALLESAENTRRPYKKHRQQRQQTSSVANQDDTMDAFERDNNMLHFVTARPAKRTRVQRRRYAATTTEEPEIMRIFEGDFNDVYSERIYNENPFSYEHQDDRRDATARKRGQRPKHQRRKSAKIVSTMFCEGYNIEQRNCNTFECSDDINDLLKFYRKYPTTDDSNAATTQPMSAELNTAPSQPSQPNGLSTLLSELGTWNTLTETNNPNANTITPTPINTGFVQTWNNLLNFTLMLTIRAKNDSYNAATATATSATTATATATIFSIRNGSQHLYVETYRDGLRLYLERDKTTEMLPIQFNLYDYRWHQVAISIKNGAFITIYIDCAWTNSFVVSSRMFSLPTNADVEVGKGFSGELQQLLILPGLQGRRQCSDKRISINEVKRYIIDTFIGDYGN